MNPIKIEKLEAMKAKLLKELEILQRDTWTRG